MKPRSPDIQISETVAKNNDEVEILNKLSEIDVTKVSTIYKSNRKKFDNKNISPADKERSVVQAVLKYFEKAGSIEWVKWIIRWMSHMRKRKKLMLFFQDVEETEDEAVIVEMDRVIDSVMEEIENKRK